jgi:hypothetical protein
MLFRWCKAILAVMTLASFLLQSKTWAQFETPSGFRPVPTEPPATEPPATEPPATEPPATEQRGPSTNPATNPATDPPSIGTTQGGSSRGTSTPGTAAPLRQTAPSQGLSPQGGITATSGSSLPNSANQIYKEFDLRPYTGYLTDKARPHQAIVDWILRDTGTDMWFTEPFGFMNANRDSLTVYHTEEIQRVVRDVVDKFVAGSKDPQAIGLRVMTVGSPNWRTRAVSLMEHVNVSSPGVQAWLVTKENAALLMAQLRQRSDTKEVQALDVIMHNGQSESLTSSRRRNYVRNVRPAPLGWPPYEPETGEVEEGYKLEISPLLNTDGVTLDCVIQANIDQVEKLVPVDLDLPLPNGQMHRARIEVPQMASWRLHERFRWPVDRVLVLSCGVIASPDRPQSSIPLLKLESLTGQTAGRADALLFVEFRGKASQNLPVGTSVASPNATFTRGRY